MLLKIVVLVFTMILVVAVCGLPSGCDSDDPRGLGVDNKNVWTITTALGSYVGATKLNLSSNRPCANFKHGGRVMHVCGDFIAERWVEPHVGP